MSLKILMNEDMKTAMRAKDSITLDAIRMLKADIKNQEIAIMKELDDEQILKIIASSIKKRKDSIEQFGKAGRIDLVEKEQKEIDSIIKYLPAQLSKDEIVAIVKGVFNDLTDSEKSNFGIVMKNVVSKVAGKADGKLVSEVVKEIIGGHN